MTLSIPVTGGSAGIGRAVAEHFLAEGWWVGLVAHRQALLDEVAGAGRAPWSCPPT